MECCEGPPVGFSCSQDLPQRLRFGPVQCVRLPSLFSTGSTEPADAASSERLSDSHGAGLACCWYLCIFFFFFYAQVLDNLELAIRTT